MQSFIIEKNQYLNYDVKGFYAMEYIGYNHPNNPNFINTLKNTFGKENQNLLAQAQKELTKVAQQDINSLIVRFNIDAVCIVPRAKIEQSYSPNQLLFKKTIKDIVSSVQSYVQVKDGTDFITRQKDTKTTHLRKEIVNFTNDGKNPYPGITLDTCSFSHEIKNKNILLIDDIYTKTVNIDEDCIEAIISQGAKSVVFYAVAKTQFRNQ